MSPTSRPSTANAVPAGQRAPYERTRSLRGRHRGSRTSAGAHQKGEAQRVWRSWSRSRSSSTSSTRPTPRTSPTRRSRARSTSLNKDFRADEPRQEQGPDRWKGSSPTRTSSSRSRRRIPDGQGDERHHADEDDARLVRHRRHGQDEGRAAASTPWPTDQVPEHLGLQPRRAGCSATRSSRAARPRPTASSSSTRRSAQTAPRRRRSTSAAPRRTRSGTGSTCATSGATRHDCGGTDLVADTPNAADAELRQADVPAHHLQQRPERRHVHELHGLRRRRRDVHVHARARSRA